MFLKRLYIAGCAAMLFGHSAFAADVLGSEGSIQVTDTDILTMLKDAKLDPSVVTTQGVNQLVGTELTRRLLISEAKKHGFDRQPEVQRAMARAADNQLTQLFLDSQAVPPLNYPSDAELQQVFDANRGKFMIPKRVSVQQIFVPGTDDVAQKRAAALDADLKAHPDTFGDVADRNLPPNAPANAPKGGMVGWVPVKGLPPEIANGIEGVPKGGVSNVIPDTSGFHIIRVLDRADEQPATLEQARADLTKAMRQQKSVELAKQYVAKLQSDSPPNLNSAAIAKLAAKSGAPAPK